MRGRYSCNKLKIGIESFWLENNCFLMELEFFWKVIFRNFLRVFSIREWLCEDKKKD